MADKIHNSCVKASSKTSNSSTETKKMAQVTTEKSTDASKKSSTLQTSAPKRPLPFVGKRRGGKILKTGIVEKKKKPEDETDNVPKDPWARYMAEVAKYKKHEGSDDDKNRPLVK